MFVMVLSLRYVSPTSVTVSYRKLRAVCQCSRPVSSLKQKSTNAMERVTGDGPLHYKCVDFNVRSNPQQLHDRRPPGAEGVERRRQGVCLTI